MSSRISQGKTNLIKPLEEQAVVLFLNMERKIILIYVYEKIQ